MSKTDELDRLDPVAQHHAERAARSLTGLAGTAVTLVAAGRSLFALFCVLVPLPALGYRMGFVAVVLPLAFLAYLAGGHRSRRGQAHPRSWRWALAVIALLACAYPLSILTHLSGTGATALDVLFAIYSAVLGASEAIRLSTVFPSARIWFSARKLFLRRRR